MRLGRSGSFCYYSSLVLQWICVGGLVLFGGAQALNSGRLDTIRWGVVVVETIAWLNRWGTVALPTLPVLLVLGHWTCHIIGPPWVWGAIHAVLNEFREHAFHATGVRDPLHYHRVTLFRFCRCRWLFPLHSWRSVCWPWGVGRWPWSGWLVPVARSGHTTKTRSTIFLAPDDADCAEGIAGQTWTTNTTLPVSNLPLINEEASPEDIGFYAQQTFVTEQWIRARIAVKALPRSLHGIPVEVNGRLWGVLVLDSRSEAGIKMNRAGKLVSVMGVVLDKLLERVR